MQRDSRDDTLAEKRRRGRCSYLATMRNLKLVTVGWIRNKTRPSPQRFSVAVVSYSFRFLPHTHTSSRQRPLCCDDTPPQRYTPPITSCSNLALLYSPALIRCASAKGLVLQLLLFLLLTLLSVVLSSTSSSVDNHQPHHNPLRPIVIIIITIAYSISLQRNQRVAPKHSHSPNTYERSNKIRCDPLT